MKEQLLTEACCSKQEHICFYDAWYARGYMSSWPDSQRRRVFAFVRSLGLPEHGCALDFGCGNGVFTDVLRQALPGWRVCGVDISTTAINNARGRYQSCTFLLLSEALAGQQKFDFLFSHHVLEHVDDLRRAWVEMSGLLKEDALMCHVLPCANPGSLEYSICADRKDGFDLSNGGRFVFEDQSHLRRLTTRQMDAEASMHGFVRVRAAYCSHCIGALDWISLTSVWMIGRVAAASRARNFIAAVRLGSLWFVLVALKILRFPANTIDCKRKRMSSMAYWLFVVAFLPLYPLSRLMNALLSSAVECEWERRSGQENGSEMFLGYRRNHE